MRSQDEPRALFDGKAQGGQRFSDARIVGDDAAFQGNIEVHANEDALSFEIEVFDG